MPSFSSYFLAKNPLRQEPFFASFVSYTVLVLGASDAGFTAVLAVVLTALTAAGLVVLAFAGLADAFGFFVAIFPP